MCTRTEGLGLDGALVRVHHVAQQLSDPFPLLAAIAMRTGRIEIGTGVVDMRYANPPAMAEQAATTDLLSDGRLQFGVSRGSPETALHGSHAFGHVPADGDEAAMAREHTARFRAAVAGATVVDADPRATGVPGRLAVQPQSPGLPDRIWWGSGTRASAVWYFGDRADSEDQVGLLGGVRSRFGRTLAGPPDRIARELARDAAVREADTLLLTVGEHARRRLQHPPAGHAGARGAAGDRVGARRPASRRVTRLPPRALARRGGVRCGSLHAGPRRGRTYR